MAQKRTASKNHHSNALDGAGPSGGGGRLSKNNLHSEKNGRTYLNTHYLDTASPNL